MRGRTATFSAAALGLVLALAAWPPPPAAAENSTMADYRSRVAEARGIVESALPRIAEERVAHETAVEVNTLLPAVERVTLDGRELRVDNSVLRSIVARLDAARTENGRREAGRRMFQHLTSLRNAVATSPEVPADPSALRELLRDRRVQARRSLAEALARVVEGARRWLAERLGGLGSRGGAAGRVALIATIAALLLALSLVGASVLRQVRRGLARRETEIAVEPAGAVVPAAEDLPADALGHADALAGERRFREALRALFGGAARSLAEKGLVRQSRTRTNSELLDEAGRGAPGALPPLAALTSAFERAWYGHADPGAEGYAAARERYSETMRELGRAASAGGEAG